MNELPERIQGDIPNWGDYNPRNDLKEPSWFRFNHQAAAHEKIQAVPFQYRWVWLCLLSVASEQNKKGAFDVGTEYFIRKFDVPRSDAVHAMWWLAKAGLAAFSVAWPEPVREPVGTRTDADQVPVVSREKSGSHDTNVRYERHGRHTEPDAERTPNAIPPPQPPDTPVEKINPVRFFADLVNRYTGPPLTARPAAHLSRKQLPLAHERWRERPDPQYWIDVLEKACGSPFLRGEVNRDDSQRPFKFNVGFLLTEGTAERILAGEFDDSAGGSGRRIEWEDDG